MKYTIMEVIVEKKYFLSPVIYGRSEEFEDKQ